MLLKISVFIVAGLLLLCSSINAQNGKDDLSKSCQLFQFSHKKANNLILKAYLHIVVFHRNMNVILTVRAQTDTGTIVRGTNAYSKEKMFV